MDGSEEITGGREEVLVQTEVIRKTSFLDLLLLPVGVVSGLFVSVFPLSLLACFVIAVLIWS